MSNQEPKTENSPTPSKISRLAIASLILALAFFVPLAPVVGAVIGIVALVKVWRSHGKFRGMGIAFLAIPLGIICFNIQSSVVIPALVKLAKKRSEVVSKDYFKSANLPALELRTPPGWTIKYHDPKPNYLSVSHKDGALVVINSSLLSEPLDATKLLEIVQKGYAETGHVSAAVQRASVAGKNAVGSFISGPQRKLMVLIVTRGDRFLSIIQCFVTSPAQDPRRACNPVLDRLKWIALR